MIYIIYKICYIIDLIYSKNLDVIPFVQQFFKFKIILRLLDHA